MNYSVAQIDTAKHIVRNAERQIIKDTGLRMPVLVCTPDERKTPEHMLKLVAIAMHMHAENFARRTRKREFVELRFVGALLLRKFFPRITLKEIGKLFGGLDHTSVINGVARAYDLLETNDPVFTYKYETALNTINSWVKEH